MEAFVIKQSWSITDILASSEGTHLMVVGGRGRRGRGSELPALRTGSLAAVFLSHTGWDLDGERDRDKRRIKEDRRVRESISFTPKISIPPARDQSLTFQRGVSEALGARWPSGEHVRPHVGGRDGRRPIPWRQLGLRLEERRWGGEREKEADGGGGGGGGRRGGKRHKGRRNECVSCFLNNSYTAALMWRLPGPSHCPTHQSLDGSEIRSFLHLLFSCAFLALFELLVLF